MGQINLPSEEAKGLQRKWATHHRNILSAMKTVSTAEVDVWVNWPLVKNQSLSTAGKTTKASSEAFLDRPQEEREASACKRK